MPTLMLVDGNSLTYRAFHALPQDLATSSGQVTNAVLGFTNMLVNLVRDHKPDGVAVAFDRPEPTFRHEAEPEYKAQREAAPDILRQQMGLVREVLGNGSILGFPIFGENFEPWIVMILPPGGFLTLGFILLGLNWWQRRQAERAEVDPVADEPARRVA